MFKNFDSWAWYALAFTFALTTSTALTSILAFGALLWGVTHPLEWWNAVKSRWNYPVFVAVLIFFVILLAGVLISLVHGYSPWQILGKHTKFIVFFILVGMLHTTERRQAVFLGFGIGMTVSLLISVLAATLGIQIAHAIPGGELSPFLNHTEHNIFLSLAIFGFASLFAASPKQKTVQLASWLLFVLSFIDVIVLIQGRTGQIVFMMLTLFFILTILRTSTYRIVAATLFIAAIIVSAIYGQSALTKGVVAAKQDIGEYHKGQEGVTATSVGFRMNASKSTFSMILDTHPIIGNGTGGFKEGYELFFKTHPRIEPPFANPHNDYLFYWAENGIFGLAALIWIYLSMFYSAIKRRGVYGSWLAALALAWCIPSIGNSVMLDHTSGYAFITLLAALIAGPIPFKSA
jgi:O-antigen ligase